LSFFVCKKKTKGGKNGQGEKTNKIKSDSGNVTDMQRAGEVMQVNELDAIPKPPKDFDKKALEVWNISTKALFNIGLLYGEDIQKLEQYCRYCSLSLKAKLILDKQGIILKEVNQGGHEYHTKNKWWSIMMEADKQMIKLSQEFGFSPAARTKISMPTKQDNDLDKQMFG